MPPTFKSDSLVVPAEVKVSHLLTKKGLTTLASPAGKSTPVSQSELSSKAKLQLQIGNGQYKPNTKPQIVDTTIYPESLYGSRIYTITCIATDTEMDALTHLLTINPSGSILQKASGNTWKWHTPDLDETKSIWDL